VTTDHISRQACIADSPAGRYLQGRGVERRDFNSYGSRRGNHEVMMRGTFANIRIRNEMVPGVEGGMTRYLPGTEVVSIYDAAVSYQQGSHSRLLPVKSTVPAPAVTGRQKGRVCWVSGWLLPSRLNVFTVRI
jgi:aconitase A